MRLLGFAALMAAFVGCSEPLPTPPSVDAEYRALLQSVDEELPGRSVKQLTDFMIANREFDIITEVEREIGRLRELAEGQYRIARDLARAGDFDRAEEILEDLAVHFPKAEVGESAGEHLAFDFYYGKAQALAALERWEEVEEVARALLDRDLTAAQEKRIQATLDAVSTVGAAYSRANRAQAMIDTRLIVIYLEMTYAEEGQYPSRLSLSDVAEWDPVGSRSMLRTLSAIEDYAHDEASYSFTAVSADEQHRVRVVDGVIER